MIFPSILPDEFAPGYLGRVMRINAWSDPKLLRTFLSTTPIRDVTRYQTIPWVVVLSKFSGLSDMSFASNHTMLMLYNCMISYPRQLHLTQIDLKSSNHGIRPGGYFCSQCIEEDHDRYGMPYWHREHQLPGLYWCLKHGDALCHVNSRDPFASSPAQCTTLPNADHSKWVHSIKENSIVKRYASIARSIAAGRLTATGKALIQPILKIRYQHHRHHDLSTLSNVDGCFMQKSEFYELRSVVALAIKERKYCIRHYSDTIRNTKTQTVAAIIYALTLAVISHAVKCSPRGIYSELKNIDQLLGF